MFFGYLPLLLLFELPVLLLVKEILVPALSVIDDPSKVSSIGIYKVIQVINSVGVGFYLLWCAFITRKVVQIKYVHLAITTAILALILVGLKFLAQKV
jgi:hypothetical protein